MVRDLPFHLDTMRPLRIPGFATEERICGNGLVPVPLDLLETSSEEWFERFQKRVFAAADRREWLPIYRLSDGEFTCMVGRRFPPLPWKIAIESRCRHYYNSLKRLSPFYSSGRPGYCESYLAWELPGVLGTLAKSLRMIGNDGMLCFNFSASELASPYMATVCSWLDDRGVVVSPKSYFHFYHVYGLLNGPESEKLLEKRRVLVMTSNIAHRKEALLDAVRARGASDAFFYETSRNRPAFDVIRLAEIPPRIDLVLIGAGVGAAHILAQLKPLGCPAIDAGFALDCWAEPSLALKRPYCVPDSQWASIHGTSVPEWCPAKGGVSQCRPAATHSEHVFDRTG